MSKPSPDTTASKHVLIVEDHAPTRTLLGECVSDEGWIPHLAATPDEARQLGAAHPLVLVVMDVCVPLPEDGESLAHALRSIRTNLPILAVSASPEEAIAARIGAYEFLPKPFELGDLLDAMERGVQEDQSPGR